LSKCLRYPTRHLDTCPIQKQLEHVPRIRLEKEPQGRLRWLTQEEITRLLEAAGKSRNKELRAAVIVALNTGLRLGELIGLTWEQVDLSRGVIRLELTKSGRRREVPMNDASYRALVGLGPKGSGRVGQVRTLLDNLTVDALAVGRTAGRTRST
jgi:integrase